MEQSTHPALRASPPLDRAASGLGRPDSADTAPQAALADFLARHPRLLVLTGAGCSTESGIPDYRDANGDWKRPQPVTFQAFTGDPATRRRYWARSLLGWATMAQARPGAAHQALARLEAAGHVELLLTQNVDGLHQAAGSRRVVDLHGRIDTVVCLGCGARSPRAGLQQRLAALNPAFAQLSAGAAPDGDADLEQADFSAFQVPDCPHCGGLLKPDVVFFGESVPRERVAAAMAALARADALLVAGSSLMVYSGYRFALAAAEQGRPIAAVNLGRTRADALLALKVEASCGEALAALARLDASTL
ncbi:NAD-dependent protein deacetylase [Pseudorhodoferax sp.]|uniref:NAD-dependent protein deacetylase n=1 Tax=Pseudorhodoferax sp. TaxID=1993553 RepID=UPI0039E4B8A3